MATFGQSFEYRDDKGQTSSVKMFILGDTQADAATVAGDIKTAMDALTNAASGGARGALTTSPAVNSYGANAEYERIETKAVLVFQTSTGALHRYRIPAPKSAIFMADGETVDPANGLVTAFVTAMLAGAASRDGVALASYIGGTLAFSPMQRRYNIFTKNPALSGPGL